MDIVLFTTRNPKCRALERKLIEKDIRHTEITDMNEIAKFGITDTPVLKVGDELMGYDKALEWAMRM